MDASVGPATVLRQEEEGWIVATLLYAAHNHLGLSRSGLVEAVRKLCSDGRQVPWKPEQGPGPKWVRGFLKRHPQLSERSSRIYEANRGVSNDDERLRSFCGVWEGFTKDNNLQANHLWNTDETGATPQGTKTLKLITECGQKVVSTVRSNSRENMTMVTTINAAGDVLFPLIISKGQRVQAAWMDETKGPENARYARTESPFMQGSVFIEYLKAFHNQLEERGLLDGKPHVLVLDGHASHVNFDVIKLAKTLNIVLFQLPSHTSLITQPLDVAAFGSFKQQMTKVLTRFPMEHGGRTPLKSDMVGIIGEAFRSSFSKEQNIASFAAAGLRPANMEKAMGRLQGCGKRKERPTDREALSDIPVAITEKELQDSLGERAVRKLQQQGYTVTGLRVGTVMLGGVVKTRRYNKKRAISRSSGGVPDGGLLTCNAVLAACEEDDRRKKEAEAEKAERATLRMMRRAESEANLPGRRRGGGRGSGDVRGRGRGIEGRGGGAGRGDQRDEQADGRGRATVGGREARGGGARR
eukprot:jgi/Undpi1/12613/HiC_scaffold_6.g02282.m1